MKDQEKLDLAIRTVVWGLLSSSSSKEAVAAIKARAISFEMESKIAVICKDSTVFREHLEFHASLYEKSAETDLKGLALFRTKPARVEEILAELRGE